MRGGDGRLPAGTRQSGCAAGALDRLEAFASFHGPDFYGLPRNRDTLTLEKSPWTVPSHLMMGETPLTPLMAGETMSWRVRG